MFKILLSTIAIAMLFNECIAQKHFVGLTLSGGTSGINFENSEGKELDYSKNLSSAWSASYAYNKSHFLAEVRVGYANLESNYITSGLTSINKMGFMRTSLVASVLLFKGPVRFKLGIGGSSGHLMSGTQTNNGNTTDTKESAVYKSTEFAGLGEAGLVFMPSDKTMIQFTYFHRMGLSNLETNTSQSSKTISNGLQASFYFGF